MTEIGRRFASGEKPATATGLANSLGVPARLAALILNSLVQARLLVEVAGSETGYSPSRPLDQITARDVLRGLRAGQGEDIATHADIARDVVRGEFDAILASEDLRAGAVTLSELVRRASTTAPTRA
jgi:DNA-binding IscR family transcriptional regulator